MPRNFQELALAADRGIGSNETTWVEKNAMKPNDGARPKHNVVKKPPRRKDWAPEAKIGCITCRFVHPDNTDQQP